MDLPTVRRWLCDARARTRALAGGLGPDRLLGPALPIVNPPLWELGHVGWFQERWMLRRAGSPPRRPEADALYDSIAIAHDRRWSLPLPSLEATLTDLDAVLRAVLERLERPAPDDLPFALLTLFHEDMHLEAMAFSHQTLGWPAPPLVAAPERAAAGGPCPGDVHVPGGTFLLGAEPAEPFVFDNEQWAHPVTLAPFSIARAPVTQAEFEAFVLDGGYARRAHWSEAGWAWRAAARAEAPAYWERAGGGFVQRVFDGAAPLAPHAPVVHVSWYEADAFCRAAGRRLPTEAEWEAAAAGEAGPDGRLSRRRRRYPWGDDPPSPARAHLDARALAPLDVGALPAGDSAFGCRQLLGNVWEWTASPFLPYPGFTPGAYREYSEPWFGTHRVLRGGSFATPGRLVRNTWRNFYSPDRRDPWAGFRTCAA